MFSSLHLIYITIEPPVKEKKEKGKWEVYRGP
jgi:hypothetical protein